MLQVIDLAAAPAWRRDVCRVCDKRGCRQCDNFVAEGSALAPALAFPILPGGRRTCYRGATLSEAVSVIYQFLSSFYQVFINP